MGKQNNWYTTI